MLGCSIWTIDLAHLLRRFGMSVVFTTITVGTNPEYADELFYAENMHADEKRVQQLFLVRSRLPLVFQTDIISRQGTCLVGFNRCAH